MPEHLPAPEKSLKQIEKENNDKIITKKLKKLNLFNFYLFLIFFNDLKAPPNSLVSLSITSNSECILS